MLVQRTEYNVVYVVKYNPQWLDICEMIFNCDLFFKLQISLALDSVEGRQISIPTTSFVQILMVHVNLQLPHWFCAIVFEPAFFIKLYALEYSFSKEYRHGTWFKECFFIWQVSLRSVSSYVSGYLENVLTYAQEIESARLTVLLLSPSPSIRGVPASLARGEGEEFILSCDFGTSKKSLLLSVVFLYDEFRS